MRLRGEALAAALFALSLAGCGDNSQTSPTATSNARGTLVVAPPRLASLNAADFASNVSATTAGQQLLQLAGTPVCGVDFYYLTYWTVDGTGQPVTATGALMVPTASSSDTASTCSGPRPVVLYAHGTSADKTMNLADISNPGNTEGALIATEFAAQGFIVVAPNYAGYDASSATYHPFLNGDQQSKDMIDALTSARAALPNTFASATKDSGALLITGYSQGGYVAMATHMALQALGQPVVASAPMSGPYALEAFGDSIFFGNVNIGSTEFAPLVVRSYQESYGNVYTQPSDIFEAQYVGAATLLPSVQSLDSLFAANALPETALFNSTPPVTGTAAIDALLAVPDPTVNPIGAVGFGPSNLVTNDFRLAYVLDAVATSPDPAVPASTQPAGTTGLSYALAASPGFPLRQNLKLNDLRNWTTGPTSPVFLCGGGNDPTVFYSINTGTMLNFFNTVSAGPLVTAGLVSYLDIDPTAAPLNAPGTPITSAAITQLQQAFAATIAGIEQQGGETALLENYHTEVAPFCTTAARGFFEQVLATLPAS
jgi:predicted esterase